jgi:hypothetical protein
MFIGLLALGSQLSALCGTDPSPLAGLAQRIAAADRIIVTNWAASRFGELGFGIPIPAEKVRGIVKAVSTATHCGHQEHPDWEWGWQLRFYRGTNFLAAICFKQDTFLANGVYRDPTGLLERVYHRSVKQQYVSQGQKDADEEFAESKKAEAKAWLKSPLHTIPGEDKKKVRRYVNEFYGAGASKVFVADLLEGENPLTEDASYLCVALPKDEHARRKVFRVHWRAVREWGFDADGDVGQKYTWYPIGGHGPSEIPGQSTSGEPILVVCPNCGEMSKLRATRTLLDSWRCPTCGYFQPGQEQMKGSGK